MKKFALLFSFIVLCAFNASAQDEDYQADMMKAWQEYMTPGPMHEMLAKSVGNWKSEITMWMDPSQPPSKTEGTAVCEPILGGRYFQITHNSKMMEMPFTGIETSGYDNAKKIFFSTWIDNMGTGIMYSEGKYDEKEKTITYLGTAVDPMGKEAKYKQVFKYIDNDNSHMDMYMLQDGKEIKNMEITFTRTK